MCGVEPEGRYGRWRCRWRVGGDGDGRVIVVAVAAEARARVRVRLTVIFLSPRRRTRRACDPCNRYAPVVDAACGVRRGGILAACLAEEVVACIEDVEQYVHGMRVSWHEGEELLACVHTRERRDRKATRVPL